MAISREDIKQIAQSAANKVLESQGSCVSAGMTLFRDHDSFRKATPIIFRVNLKGLVLADDLKVPHSELAMHVGAAGRDLIAFALTGTQTGVATYDKGDGSCGFIFGREDELFHRPLIEKMDQMWEKRGPGPKESNPGQTVTITDPGKTTFKVGEIISHEAFGKENVRVRKLGEKAATGKAALPTRDKVRVEVWEERDRLHIGIQDKETGEYYVSWWDDDARQMFEDGFFKSGKELEESVLQYAEDMGLLKGAK